MEILKIIIFAVVVLVLFSVLNKYVLKKIKINKFIVLFLAALFLSLPIPLHLDPSGFLSRYIFSGLFLLFFLWFLDLLGLNKKMEKEGKNLAKKRIQTKNKNNVVIRPKAKPNRVKNTKK